MNDVTASKAGLLGECQYWARPEAEWHDAQRDDAEAGTRFHGAIAQYVETGNVLVLDEDITPLVASAVAWVDSFGREQLRAEVAFAWDPATDTAEIIGQNIGRDYSAGGGRICGTADIVAISRVAKAGYVGDWSTGDGSKKGPQLRTLALMLARAEGLVAVTVEGLEVSAEGVRSVCREDLDAFDFASVAGEIAENLAKVPTAEPKPGPHCAELFCPALATCPAGRAIVEQVIPATDLLAHRWQIQIQSPEHAVWLYDHAKLVAAAAEAVKEAVKAYVPDEGLLLHDGRVLAESTRRMPRFSKDRALGVMRELGATEQQIESCTTVVTEGAGLRLKAAPKLRRGKAAA